MNAPKMCSVEGCSNPLRARGLCASHWSRWKRLGHPDAATPLRDVIRADAMTRFVERIEIDHATGCWQWAGTIRADNYGQLRVNNRSVVAHRWGYEQTVEPVAAGLHLDHLCRNRACVNPDHLEPVTPRVNTLRGETTPSVNAMKTHCIHGHPFSAENTYVSKRGWRMCRECMKARKRARRLESKAVMS